MQKTQILSSARWNSHWRRGLLRTASLLAGGLLLAALWIWITFTIAASKVDLTTLDKVKQGTHVEDRHGVRVGVLFADHRKFVAIEQVPKDLIDALIATEDARFFEHHGFDYKGICRAMVRNVSGMSVRQGGSTITQQLARQAFQLKGRTIRRKLQETFVACRIERHYSKQQILEYYLNQIYLGNGFHGIGSAARGYFGKEVSELSLEESSLLVGIIKAPVSYSPFRNMELAKRARDLTLQRLAMVDPEQNRRVNQALRQPVRVLPEDARRERPNYLLAAAERHLDHLAKEGRSGPWKKVTLSVDARLQGQLDNKVSTYVSALEKKLAKAKANAQVGESALQAAVVVMDNQTGGIVATCGGRDFQTSPFDRALLGRRPVGTAFLPLSYAAMLSVDPELASMLVLDAPLDNRRAMIGGERGTLGEWGAESNHPIHEGMVPVLYALAKGKTGATVRLAQHIGLERTRSALLRCEFDSPLTEYSSVVLGSSPLRLVDVARAYTALASRGMIAGNHSLVMQTHGFQNGEGIPMADPASQPRRQRVFGEQAAEQVRNVLTMAMQDAGIVAVLQSHGLANSGVAGWGGTAYGGSDAWFVGFDQNITCAVWVGYDETRSMGEGVWARQVALPLWAEVMAAAATQGKPRGWQVDPSSPGMKSSPSSIGELGAKEVIPFAPKIHAADAGQSRAIRPQSAALIGDDPYRLDR
jgi:membrane peptidoglycan carboxypeptidase